MNIFREFRQPEYREIFRYFKNTLLRIIKFSRKHLDRIKAFTSVILFGVNCLKAVGAYFALDWVAAIVEMVKGIMYLIFATKLVPARLLHTAIYFVGALDLYLSYRVCHKCLQVLGLDTHFLPWQIAILIPALAFTRIFFWPFASNLIIEESSKRPKKK
jgi:hypothetical protein